MSSLTACFPLGLCQPAYVSGFCHVCAKEGILMCVIIYTDIPLLYFTCCRKSICITNINDGCVSVAQSEKQGPFAILFLIV